MRQSTKVFYDFWSYEDIVRNKNSGHAFVIFDILVLVIGGKDDIRSLWSCICNI